MEKFNGAGRLQQILEDLKVADRQEVQSILVKRAAKPKQTVMI